MGWARLIFGRFCDAVLRDSQAPFGSGAFLMPFPLTLIAGDTVVDTSQGLRLFAAFGLPFSLFRNYRPVVLKRKAMLR